MEESFTLKKKQLLRNCEYYSIQNVFDELYKNSHNNKVFINLMQYITSKKNILLAYRNIKNNKGSTTVGIDKLDISHLNEMDNIEFVNYFKDKLANYNPKGVKRVEIPKSNGNKRPLGIPCIDDRVIQQCIKQVLEPICEAKFHKHSYGFRANRSTEHAIARCMYLINMSKLHYVVDIDIKGFFDNVNHGKLKKQLWSLGVQDKNLISILGKILKSEIEGVGIPTKGTPQGGIISPLLANVVLNELDWWISSQWETFRPSYEYSISNKYKPLKNKNLKEMWLVRYADDVKIFCRDYKTAFKVFKAFKMWLKDRLDLDINLEKSKVTNLRKKYTEYLGFKLFVKRKRNKHVCQSRMSNTAKNKTIRKLKEQIRKIQKANIAKEVSKLNSIILGSHNYYKFATKVCLDFKEINFLVTKTLEIRLKSHISEKPKISKTYKKLYDGYKGKKYTIQGVTIFPIYGCKNKPPMCFSQGICNYTHEGRQKIHNNLKGDYIYLIQYLLSIQAKESNFSTEYNDNKISLMVGQRGKCYVTNTILKPHNMECHHKKMESQGGTNEYKNLTWLCGEAHKLIHATVKKTIEKYLGLLSLDEQGLKRVNSLRKLVGNSVI